MNNVLFGTLDEMYVHIILGYSKSYMCQVSLNLKIHNAYFTKLKRLLIVY